MEQPLVASSFHPPDLDSAAASSYPAAWVLLDRKAYLADRENATTATATSRTGHTVKVTFCLADPPAVSHFCVHGGPEFNSAEHLVDEPRVVSSEKDLVLLSFVFTVGDCHHGEYFIYKAGRGKPPSLQPIPAPPPETTSTLCVSIAPCDDGEFVLADLYVTTTLGNYDLTIFSSKTAKWTTRRLEVRSPSAHIRAVDLVVVPHKVITLGGGSVGWVDLWRGIIVCNNVLEEEPFIYFIPLPKPDFNLPRIGNPKPVRDVVCHNDGVIKLVEMDNFFRNEVVRRSKRFKVTEDLDSVDRMYDEEILLLPLEAYLEGPGEQVIRVPDGWKIRTCYRHISWDHWRKGHSVHVDDIFAKHSVLLPQLWDGKVGRSTLRNLTTAYPTLGLNGDDVVYLMSKVEYHDKNAWMVGVHLGNRTVEILEPYGAERARDFKLDCLPCPFSEFLNTTPRSCAEEAAFASSEAQNLSNLPQPLQLNLTSSGSGHAHPVNSQSMYPEPVLSRDAHGQLWLSVPLGEAFMSQLLQLAGQPFTPPMPQMSVAEAQENGGPANVISTSLGMPSIQADGGLANVMSRSLGMPAAPALQPKDGSPNISTELEIQALSGNHAS